MANKSYIMIKEKIILDNEYEIPIIHKILVSGSPQIIDSKMFNDRHAIKSDYDKGLCNLKKFFDEINKEDMFKIKEAKDLFIEVINVLSSNNAESIILEPEEILLLDENLNVNKLFEEINNENIENIINQIKNDLKKYEEELAKVNKYPDTLGIIFKRKNKNKMKKINDINNSVDYYIKYKIGIHL